MGFNWTIIAPEIAILVTGFVILVSGLFLKKGRNSILTAISLTGILIALGLTFKSFSITDLSFQGIVIGDRISFFFKIIGIYCFSVTPQLCVRIGKAKVCFGIVWVNFNSFLIITLKGMQVS